MYAYECMSQLGVAGFRIDLAVRHPKHPSAYLAAIECDGAAYHSGRSARDRDRIRQEILEALGWRGRIYRIWSTDWYRGPANELARLTAWLEHLKEQPMDKAYLAPPEPVVMPALTPIQVAPVAELAGTQLTLESLGVTIEEEDELPEVQEGDRVTYMTLFDNREMSVTIGTRTDITRGLIAYTTPLAEALLGLQQGEEGTLRQPGRPEVRFRIVRIERSSEAEKSLL
jgi:very-short-patch-repair endonuclease